MQPANRGIGGLMLVILLGSLVAAAAVSMTPTQGLALKEPQGATVNRVSYHICSFPARDASQCEKSPGTRYVASWRKDGAGDNVVFQGWGMEEKTFHDRPDAYWYEVTLGGTRQDGRPGTMNYESPGLCPSRAAPRTELGFGTGSRFDMEACKFQLKGPAIGILEVYLWVKICTFGKACKEHDVAYAQALVEDGLGSMEISGQKSTYQEGDAVKLRVRTGSCGAAAQQPGFSGCFRVLLHDPSGKVVQEWPIEEKAGETSLGRRSWKYLEWKVPKGAFKAKVAGWDNTWSFELVNDVISWRTQNVFTIDSLLKAPSVTKVVLSPKTLVEGEPARVDVTAAGNVNGSGDIGMVRVWVWYGTSTQQPGAGASEWVVEGRSVPASYYATENGVKTYTAGLEFGVNRVGELQVKAVAYDTDSRPSEAASVSRLTQGAMPAEKLKPDTGNPWAFVLAAFALAIVGVTVTMLRVRNHTHKWAISGTLIVAAGVFTLWIVITMGAFHG